MIFRTVSLALVASAGFAIPSAFAQQTLAPGAASTPGLLQALKNAAEPTHAALSLPIEALSIPEVRAAVSPIALDPDSGVAIGGFDPVGYFKQKQATKGSPEFTADYQGARFQFASAENRDEFLADPDAFAPAYGGYCAQSLAAGKLTPGDPTQWSIVGNRLYFTRSTGAQEAFSTNIASVLKDSDRCWKQVGFDFRSQGGSHHPKQ